MQPLDEARMALLDMSEMMDALHTMIVSDHQKLMNIEQRLVALELAQLPQLGVLNPTEMEQVGG